MSDSTTLTRCPHCQTRFRVTEQQLGVASGKVRCGNCMEVFNAREHAVAADPVTPPAKTPAEKPAASPPAPSSTRESLPETEPSPEDDIADEDEFIFQDNPEEDALDGRYNQSYKVDDDFSDSFLALDRGNRFEDETDEAEQIGEVDESWAEEILHDDALLSDRPKRTPPEDVENRARPDIPDSQPKQDGQTHKPVAPPPRPREREQPLKATPPETASRRPLEELSLSVERDDVRFGEPEGDNRKHKSSKTATPPPARPYDNLRSTPVAAGSASRRWGMNILWALGCLLLIGFVASQLFYFQFDRLSRYEPLRPLYTAACPLIGCELPEMVDTGLIESRKLVVRSHPEEPKALLVEALIVNQAPFEQPFPAIVLTFSNLNNDVVAQRSFKPAEYLASDARDLSTMPSSTPVKIALELRDPGQDAVNYSLRFLPAAREGQQ